MTGGLTGFVQRARGDLTLRREADVMGLTVCIAVLAALTAGNDHTPHTRLDVVAASIVVLLIPQAFDRLGARITAALFLALLVGVESRVKWFVG